VLGPAAEHRFEYPLGETSIRGATYVAHNGSRLPGSAGVAAIVETVLASMRPGCTPIRLAVVMAGSEHDPRGESFADTASVRRATNGAKEIDVYVGDAIDEAVERGHIEDHPFQVLRGGMGARVPWVEDTPELRMAERFLRVRLIQQAPVQDKGAR
jgi:hypothetical protein